MSHTSSPSPTSSLTSASPPPPWRLFERNSQLDADMPMDATKTKSSHAVILDEEMQSMKMAVIAKQQSVMFSIMCASQHSVGLPLSEPCERHQCLLESREKELRSLQQETRATFDLHTDALSALQAEIEDLTGEAARATEAANLFCDQLHEAHELQALSGSKILQLQAEISNLQRVATRTRSLIREAHFVAETGGVAELVDTDDELQY
ncbi:hypothetical protein C8J57DRAFT_1512840 [Mycena rebaudengoi]|nr:hypothetical protein C8J57DRAFT_1512840 [Mycena rebaudengoi]